MNKKVCDALMFAMRRHEGQKRKYGGADYIIHPVQVYEILKLVTDDDEVLCAGLLHDTLEDTETTHKELVKLFGKRVASIVLEVTHDELGKFHIRTREGLMVKIADVLSNIHDCPDSSYVRNKALFINELVGTEKRSLKHLMELDADLSSVPKAK